MHGIILIALVGVAADVSPASTLQRDPAAPRPLHELMGEVRDMLRAEVAACDSADRARIVAQLAHLCEQIGADPRFSTSPILKRLRGSMVSRLRRVKRVLERDLERQANETTPASINQIAGIVAAQVANAGRAAVPPAAFAPIVQVGVGRDHGQELARLIERVISPNSWDVNGGRSTIVYYAPLRVLVVHAPSEVHGRLGGLLGDIRGAGGF